MKRQKKRLPVAVFPTTPNKESTQTNSEVAAGDPPARPRKKQPRRHGVAAPPRANKPPPRDPEVGAPAERLGQYYSVKSLAKLLDCSRKAIWMRHQRGQLKAVPGFGRRLHFREADVVAFLREREVPSTPKDE